MPLQRFEQPTFTESENVFLRHYAQSRDRVGAMYSSGLAQEYTDYTTGELPSTATLELAGSAIIAKAETLPLEAIASALGADKIMLLAAIWKIGTEGEPRDAIKALNLMARIHGMLDAGRHHAQPVNLILHPPDAPPAKTPASLPFSLDGVSSDG
jgi:hypothetical protein